MIDALKKELMHSRSIAMASLVMHRKKRARPIVIRLHKERRDSDE